MLFSFVSFGLVFFFLVRLYAQQISKTIQNVDSLRKKAAKDGSAFEKDNIKHHKTWILLYTQVSDLEEPRASSLDWHDSLFYMKMLVIHNTQQNCITDTWGTCGLFIPTSLHKYVFLKQSKLMIIGAKCWIYKQSRACTSEDRGFLFSCYLA